MGTTINLVPETQPIHCHFNLFCRGGLSNWRLEATPVRALWIHLCDDCARRLVAAIPGPLLAALTEEQRGWLKLADLEPVPAPANLEALTPDQRAAYMEAARLELMQETIVTTGSDRQAVALAVLRECRNDGDFMERVAGILEEPVSAPEPPAKPAGRGKNR